MKLWFAQAEIIDMPTYGLCIIDNFDIFFQNIIREQTLNYVNAYPQVLILL